MRVTKRVIAAAKRLMTAEWKAYWYDRLLGRRYGKYYKKYDRSDVPIGYCENCFDLNEVHPFGPRGKWYCFECYMKDPETMNKHLAALNKARKERRLQRASKNKN